MDLAGEQFLPVARERVWGALNDPETLRASVPGCESLERVEGEQFKVVMVAAVGPIKAKFNGKLSLSDIQPPESYTLAFEGSGGAAGTGKGTAKVVLHEEAGGTRLAYTVHAQVGGRLAQVGSRLIDGVARKMAEEFFNRFVAQVSPAAAAAATDAPAPVATGGPAAEPQRVAVESQVAPAAVSHVKAVQPPSSSKKGWWIAGAVLLVILVAYYATR